MFAGRFALGPPNRQEANPLRPYPNTKPKTTAKKLTLSLNPQANPELARLAAGFSAGGEHDLGREEPLALQLKGLGADMGAIFLGVP